jgi:cyclophilin family peptidyl-prolyl cis-trans isomerase
MWDRIRVGRSQAKNLLTQRKHLRPKRRSRNQPTVEALEDRQLMTASLQPISNLTVPAQQGYTLPLQSADTSATAHPQTFAITSSNPNIAVSIAQGPFWSLGVSYPGTTTPASSPFTGTLTFQLFQNLTPNTVSEISNLTTSGDFVNTFQYFSRVATGFPDATSYVVQGGSPTLNGAEPNPPVTFANENLQQLAFSGADQLAMANSGGRDSNTTQFFITTGSPNAELGYNYTIFGQLVTGLNTLALMTQVPVMANTNPNVPPPAEISQPRAPLTISSATLTNTNPNGVAIIDATQAMKGQTATITVTATDSVDHTKTTQSFTVTVGAYGGPPTTTYTTPPAINFRPFSSAVNTSLNANTPTTVQLAGSNGYPVSTTPSTLSYSLLSQPAHGTITNFNSATGSLTYTPNKNYVGLDSFRYEVNATGPESTPAVTTSNPATVTFTIGAGNTRAVRLVGTAPTAGMPPSQVLIVSPVPRRDRGTNTIDVLQVPDSAANGGSVVEVVVNGLLDKVQPGTGDILGVIVYGGNKAKNHITIDPSVTVPAIIDGGHGYKNRLVGGSAETTEHGWFGHSVLIAGSGPNQLIGLAGHVKFKPSKASIEIFAGVPRRRTSDLNPVPPGGTFYKFVKGRLVVFHTI